MMSSSSKKRIAIIQSGVPASVWEPALKSAANWTCLYIGTDTERYYSIRSNLPATCTFMNTGQKINELLERHFDVFQNIDCCMDLRGNDPYWLTTDVAERNPSSSDFLFYACAKLLFDDILKRNHENALAFVEDWFPGFHFAQHARRHGCDTSFHSHYSFRDRLPATLALRFHTVNQWIHAIRSRLRFLWDFRCQKRIIHSLRRSSPQNASNDISQCDVFLVTWVKHDTLSPDHPYEKDCHFGPLPELLRKRGIKLGLIANAMAWKSPFADCAANAMQSCNPVLMPQECLGFFDALRIACQTLFHSFKIKTPLMIEGVDLTDLLREEMRIEKTKTRQCRACHNLFLGRYLKKKNARPSVIFNIYENQSIEKSLLLGIKRYFPHTAIAGFQHSTIPYLWPGYFPSKRDIEYGLHPDRLIANGPVWRDLLIRRGIPADRVDLGASIRYSYLFDRPHQEEINEDEPSPSTNVVLLALPMFYAVAVECLYKTVVAFHDRTEMRIWIKFHPEMNGTIDDCFSTVRHILKLDAIPAHIETIDQPISSLLNSISLLLYSASTTGFEALFRGIPVVMIQSDIRIDLDPLAVVKEHYDRVWMVTELRETVLNRLKERKESFPRSKETGESILRKTFTPITPETLDVFYRLCNQRPVSDFITTGNHHFSPS